MVERALRKRTVVGSIPTGGLIVMMWLQIIKCPENEVQYYDKMESPGFEPGTLKSVENSEICDRSTGLRKVTDFQGRRGSS